MLSKSNDSFPIPNCLDGIYARLGNWNEFNPEEGYIKKPCMVITKRGVVKGPCWPNAGKFVLLAEDNKHIKEFDVREIAYFEGESE
mgnify:CR=1 FL=1